LHQCFQNLLKQESDSIQLKILSVVCNHTCEFLKSRKLKHITVSLSKLNPKFSMLSIASSQAMLV
jgi:hypothetical protein